MALKIVLKGGERLLVGTSKILIASDSYVTLIIEGEIPVMKEHEAIAIEEAVRPEQKLYYHVQQLYLTGAQSHKDEIGLIVGQMPSTSPWVATLNQILILINQGAYYRAVKAARRLLSDTRRPGE